jgi:1-deoxy-D-xylulose-5-phosphate reductoisomerase
MKVPIQYALRYPARWPAPHERLDWSEVTRLEFEQPDTEKFPCLRLAYDALDAGGTAPAVLNAANEAAVSLFLDEKISFIDIPRAIEHTLGDVTINAAPTLDDLYAADAEARQCVKELVATPSN